jgi:FtsP/CotA-like multicopper oxidase with cupredoxin domain
MDRVLLPNVPSPADMPLNMISPWPNSLEHFGMNATNAIGLTNNHRTRYHSHLSTQYCDGLRGPLVVYDKPDPRGSLYDFDNGQQFYEDLFTHVADVSGTQKTLSSL